MNDHIRILLVEDETLVLELAAILVKELPPPNIIMDTAGSFGEAVRKVECNLFEVIILDLLLPDSSGLDTLAKMRKVTSVPILVYTGLDWDTKHPALALGATEFVSKGRHTLKEVLVIASDIAIAARVSRRYDRSSELCSELGCSIKETRKALNAINGKQK